MRISIVSPIYKGEKMLEHLVSRCETAVEQITDDYEIVLVNDCSPDSSWQKIREICERDKHVKGVDLSRNFGQYPAISAGLGVSTGDWVVIVDCDLQDRPEEIPKLYAKAQEGWDIVQARRTGRKDKFLKRMSSKAFHVFYDWLAGYETDETIDHFGIYRRSVIEEICRIPDMSRGLESLLYHLGYRTTTVDVEHAEREEGTSGYTLMKLLALAFDFCISNSNKPLRITVNMGLFMTFLSFLFALYNIVAKFQGWNEVVGFTTTVFSIWFVGGLLLFMLGIIGLYVGRIYDQVKGRPYVVIREMLNKQESSGKQ